jgi:hypothetical protein
VADADSGGDEARRHLGVVAAGIVFALARREGG